MPHNPDPDLTQPVGTDATSEVPPVTVDAVAAPRPASAPAAAPAAAPTASGGAPAWASAAHEGDGSASARQVPAPSAAAAVPTAPGHPIATGAASAAAPVEAAKPSWRSRVSHGRGLVVAALVVGLGLGALGGSAGTWAVTHDNGTATTADGTGGFDRDGDGGFGPPGGRGGMPPGGGQAPNGTQQDGGSTGRLPGGGAGSGGSTGQLPGGGTGTDGSTNGSTDANGASEAT